MEIKKYIKLCDMTKRMLITELIGLGESQRRLYEQFEGQPEAHHKKLRQAYELHQKELELLIAYQMERNGR